MHLCLAGSNVLIVHKRLKSGLSAGLMVANVDSVASWPFMVTPIAHSVFLRIGYVHIAGAVCKNVFMIHYQMKN